MYIGSYVRLPCKDDDLYFDGFPRSGNTYLVGLLKHVYPKLKFAHHLHVVAGIKMAFKINLPVYIIIREPLVAIGSFYFTKSKGESNQIILDAIIEQYISYYKFLVENTKRIKFINFSYWLSNKQLVLNHIFQSLLINNIVTLDQISEFDQIVKLHELSKTTENSSLPNNLRDEFKMNEKERILKSNKYPIALKLYNQLSSNSI